MNRQQMAHPADTILLEFSAALSPTGFKLAKLGNFRGQAKARPPPPALYFVWTSGGKVQVPHLKPSWRHWAQP